MRVIIVLTYIQLWWSLAGTGGSFIGAWAVLPKVLLFPNSVNLPQYAAAMMRASRNVESL